MALRFMDGCAHYGTDDIYRKWTSTYQGDREMTIVATSSSRAGPCLRGPVSNERQFSVMKTLDDQATWIVGFRVMFEGTPDIGAQHLVYFLDAGVQQIRVVLGQDMRLYVVRGTESSGTVLANSGAKAINQGVWYYVEVKATIHNTTGVVEVHVNEETWINLTGANTRQSTNNTANGIAIGSMSSSSGGPTILPLIYTYFHDFYINDATGATNNTFLGDYRVDVIVPNGAGDSTDWTPSAGANWQTVDEADPNDDTDYVSSSVANDYDLYNMQDIADTNTIAGLQSCALVRKTDAGSRVYRTVCKSVATESRGANFYPGLVYNYALDIWSVDPATAVAWTQSGVNASQFGPEVQA